MGVGLQPLEFSECLADSPAFRDNLQRHEKELERTSHQIKRLIKEVKDVVQAARRLGAAQLALAASMEQFEFACIGASQTEDERVIGRSLTHFASLIRSIEDERDRMLGRAHEQIIQPLERFRKDHIGAVKEGKKKFEKKTAKFCQTQERTLALSARKPDAVFQEADAALDMAERDFCQASLEYVFQLQAVQERKKFELVETLLGFVFGWWTFHHTAHDVHADAEGTVRDLQLRIQRTRSNFEETSKQTESLMKKMMEMRQQSKEEEISEEAAQRAGYLFLQEKKAFGTTWSKQYAVFSRASRALSLSACSQLAAGRGAAGAGEALALGGARPAPEPQERRFCWEAVPQDRDRPPLLLQALSERDRASWLRAVQSPAGAGPGGGGGGGEGGGASPDPARALALEGAGGAAQLDANGFDFVQRLIAEIEARGLDEQGLYRVAGVASKTARLVSLGAEGRLAAGGPGALADPREWESRTLTSALKAFLRALPDRLLTARLHKRLIHAAKLERRWERVAALHALVRQLPPDHLRMLTIVLTHLRKVAAHSDKNLMTCGNLAVCWGPTLLRADTGTVASILDLKFCNVLVETMLEHYHDIFEAASPPPAPPPAPPHPFAPPLPHSQPHASPAHGGGAGGVPQQNGVLRAAGACGAGGGCTLALSRTDLVARTDAPLSCERGARYSPHHHQLLQQLGGGVLGAGGMAAHRALPRAPASTSSSAESVSESSASPPPAHPHPHSHAPHPTPMVIAARGPGVGAGAGAGGMGRAGRARTLYACLGESEGELSFEPNQILTNVSPSAEPGWLRATLNGRAGLVPENYVEPLP